MAVGLYSGVSGLALGIGLYRNVSGLWGGASGLIDGFGGADPYAGASLYLNFLAGAPLDSRITFSRGTNATLIDSTGKLTYAPNNLLLQSATYSDAAYTISAGVTFSGSTATFTSTGYRYQSASIGSSVAGRTFIGSVVLSSASKANILLRLNGNATGVDQATSLVTLTPTPTRYFVVRTFTSSDINIDLGLDNRTIVGGSGIAGDLVATDFQLEAVTYQTTPSTYVATAASAYYGPRFDYDPVTLAPRGLLIEEARTNLLTYSDDWSNAAWVKSGATVTANATASPDGTVNADKVVETATTAPHAVYQVFTYGAGLVYAATVYAKKAERNWIYVGADTAAAEAVFFDLDTGTVGSQGTGYVGSITNAGNGWYRCTVVITQSTALPPNFLVVGLASANGTPSYAGNGTSGAYLYGAQLEAGSFATSYIPTVASTVTRNADVAIMTGTNFSSWYNQPAGTFIADVGRFSSVNSTGTAGFLSATDNPLANDWILMFGDGIGTPSIYVTGGVTQANLVGVPITSGGKVSFAYAANDFAASVNGGTVLTDTSGTLTTDITVLRIGAFASNPNFLNGHIRTIAYFNTRLPNAQLQTLTAPSLATTLSLDFTSGSYNVGF